MNLTLSRSLAVAVTLALGGTVAGAAATSLAAPSATSSTVTRYTPQITNVRTGPSTSYTRVGTLPARTTVTGTLSNGWVKISSPSTFAGKYVSNGVLANPPASTPTTPTPTPSTPTPTTPTPSTPAPAGTPVWVGYTTTYLRNSAGTAFSKIPVNTKVTGKIANSVLFKITGGPYDGKYLENEDVLWTDPSTYGPTAPGTNKAPVGETVTRYVVTHQDPIVVRSGATTHSALVAYLSKGSAIKGEYVNDDWFKITSGTHAGRYVSSALIYTTKAIADNNGVAKKADMCALPSWTQTAFGPTQPRFVACPAAKSFVEMNAAFRAAYGYDIKVEEAYRDLVTQKAYASFYGFPRAAVPGTSNHGLGTAIDLETIESAAMAGTPHRSDFGGPYDKWLTAHGKEYGWDRPSYLDKGLKTAEPWHYNFIG